MGVQYYLLKLIEQRFECPSRGISYNSHALCRIRMSAGLLKRIPISGVLQIKGPAINLRLDLRAQYGAVFSYKLIAKRSGRTHGAGQSSHALRNLLRCGNHVGGTAQVVIQHNCCPDDAAAGPRRKTILAAS